MTHITASMLYDMTKCEHRVWMDLFEDPSHRDKVSAFVRLLWEKGQAFEKELMDGLTEPFLDLSDLDGDEREARTIEAMEEGVALIYAGRISADNLLGDPDILEKVGSRYIASDIKSGSALDSKDDYKKHYAVQLALYADILERKGLSGGRYGRIWDIHGDQVSYYFDAALRVRNSKTFWELYQSLLTRAVEITEKQLETRPGYSSGTCKLCHWYGTCKSKLQENLDLTLIPELGPSKRNAMIADIPDIPTFAACDPEAYCTKKSSKFDGIGADSLLKFHARAQLLADPEAKPYLRNAVKLPACDKELFFDIETDPMRDVCYLHGFVERQQQDNDTEVFHGYFMADTSSEEEEKAFREAMEYIQSSQPCALYYYSSYEPTTYKKLARKYPSVCSVDDIEAMFASDNAVDLYFGVVKKATEWPTYDFSIKTLAQYLGFEWRDEEPSGAASIEWFHRFVESKDPELKQRILDYNEDDCIATRVLLDGIRDLAS